MIALKAFPAPPTNVHDLARLRKRLLAGLGTEASALIRGGAGSIGSGRALLAALPVAIYTTDAEGRITFYNEAAAKLWGQRPLLGSDRYCGSWRILTSDGIALAKDQCPLAIALRTGNAVGNVETITERPDGTRVTVAPFPTLMRDPIGRVIGAINMLVDLTASKVAEAELRESEEHGRSASQLSPHMPWTADPQGRILKFSERWCTFIGQTHEEARSDWQSVVNPDDLVHVAASMKNSLRSEESFDVRYRVRTGTGEERWVRSRAQPRRDSAGAIIRWYGTTEDIHDAVLAEDEALRLSQERFRLAATAAGLGIADVDTVTGQEHWSPELRAILGVTEDVVASLDTYAAMIHADDRAAALDHHIRWLRGEFDNGHKGVHRIIRRSDGALRWISSERHAMRNDEGAIVRVIVINKDITEEKTAQDRINWAATHDAVTGLPNRSMFRGQLESALAHTHQAGESVGLLLIDLDNFKSINDTLGHLAGDQALAAFAGRIGEVMPEGAIVVRFGGDEFSVILPGANAVAAAAIAEGLIARLQYPISIGDRNIDVRASIGVSAFPDHGESGSDLVQNADLALYAAKADGRSKVRTFDPSLRADLKHQLSMLSQARTALDHGWIRPFYQPKISLATGRAVGFEALLRWRDPQTGLKLPATIACAFDDTELAGLIGEAMVLAVLADIRGWLDRGIAVGKIAINASVAEFREPGFADRLLARLAAYDVPAAMLELEITETAFLGDCAANVVVALEALRAAGMTIALDDFGTGFSSLSHLRNFPVDAIKIDRAFVAGLGDSAEDRVIIEAILRLGEALGMTTVAEGVETEAQANYLRAHGCTLAQGFLFAPAIDAADVPAAAEADHGQSGA